MSHRPPPDAELGDRLRASINGGDLPALDLEDVQRRADRRVRRKTAGTAVVAGASALAFVGVLAVTVPAINAVVEGRTPPTAAEPQADRVSANANPSDDLTDPSVWPTLSSLEGRRGEYLTASQVTAAAGSGTWEVAAADMADPWTTRACSPSPLREATEAEAGLGLRPSSVHIEPWISRRSQSEADPTPLDATALPYEAFATFAALRWDPATSGASRDWQQTVAQEAEGCPGAVQVETDAVIGSSPVVVVAQPPGSSADGSSDGSWAAMAIVAGGPTALQTTYSGALDAQAAGDAALALLREGARAVTASDRAVRELDGGARAGGVDQARLEDFTNAQRWDTLPPVHTIGAPPAVALVTPEDLEAAFSQTSSWQSQPIGGTGTDWMRSWCTPGGIVDPGIPDRPGGRFGGGYPASESASIWEGRSKEGGRPRVDIDVLRWHPRDLSGGPSSAAGVDAIALSAADAWGAAIAQDASSCPGAASLDPAGLPGTHATLSAVEDDGRWRVQAATVGGPTAVRVQTTVEADDAEAAGAQAVAMARRVIANTVRADAAAQGQADPGPLP